MTFTVKLGVFMRKRVAISCRHFLMMSCQGTISIVRNHQKESLTIPSSSVKFGV